MKQGRAVEALSRSISHGRRWVRGGRQGDEVDQEDEFRQV